MDNTQPFDRRSDERRCADLGPPPGYDERRRKAEPGMAGADPSCHLACQAGGRRKQDRRVGERRQANLGPPPGVEERRFRPDPRGVMFIYVDGA